MARHIPWFEHTEIGDIDKLYKKSYDAFHSNKTKSLAWRHQQLRNLYWGIKENLDLITEACKKDFGKPAHEVYLSEAGWVMNDIIFVDKNLEKWAKDETAADMSLINKLMTPKIRKDPLGVVLIIGAYNYPIQLAFGPLVGAIAAGNSVVLKPSESAENAASVMQMIVKKYLDNSAIQVVQGAIPETTALLDKKWDLIFYTGSANVGTIIAKKAAETLTPTVLELGGKNPAIITKNADLHLAARRTLWTKVMNAGQVCISQNYIMVEKECVDAFIAELKKARDAFFPGGKVRDSPDFSRIINNRQWKRLKKMLDDTKGKIVMGGEVDEKSKFIEPTAVLVNDVNDSLIVDESFGPLIPILPVANLDEAIRNANDISVTPLGLYAFGSNAEAKRILDETRSGGATINDSMFHGSISNLEFGGVGSSGMGSYRGKASFDAFVHRRAVTKTPNWMEMFLAVRYPPYRGKLSQAKRLQDLAPHFDRAGRTKGGLLALLFGPRTLFIVLVAYGIRAYLQRQQSKL